MTYDNIINLLLSASAGLGLGTFLNNWQLRRWESRKEGMNALAGMAGKIVGFVSVSKDTIEENDNTLEQLKRGEITADVAREKVRVDFSPIGSMVIGIKVGSKISGVSSQSLVNSIRVYQTETNKTMRQQYDSIMRIDDDTIPASHYSADLEDRERSLVNEAAAFLRKMNRAKF